MMPDFLKRLFWDTDINTIDLKKHSAYIIRKIVDFGTPQDILWMKQAYSPADIQEVIKKSRGISRKSAHYWAAYFGLPDEEIECLKIFYPKKLRPF